MKNMATSVLLWLFVLATAGFWPVYSLFGVDDTIEIASGLVAGVCLAISMQWLVEAMRSIRMGRRASDFLIFAIFLVALITFAHRQVTNLVRWSGRADWIINSPAVPYAIWMLAFGFSVILIAKGVRNGIIPSENFGWLFFALIAGLAVPVIVLSAG